MKKTLAFVLAVIIAFLFPCSPVAHSASPVASAQGQAFFSLQQAFDTARAGVTEDMRTVTLLADAHAGEVTVALTSGAVILNLNGFVLTGSADPLIALAGGASLAICDGEGGLGAIIAAGTAVEVQGAGSEITILGGSIQSEAQAGCAVVCAQGARVTVSGGSVCGIAMPQGAPTDAQGQDLTEYILAFPTFVAPGQGIFSVSLRPRADLPSGTLRLSARREIHLWLPAGHTGVSAQAGCSVYGGTFSGSEPYAAAMTQTGERHLLAGAWIADEAGHYQMCQRVGCQAVSDTQAHSGGTATCTEAGACAQCGAAYLPALGHTYVDTVISPTCTEPGHTHHECSVCGDDYDDANTEALGHTYVDTVIPPTCTEPGHTHHECSVCGQEYDDTTTAALGHDFEPFFTVDIIATCSNEGGKSRHCTRCDAVTDVTSIPATDGHTFEDAWTSDETGHWHTATCAHLALRDGFAAHAPIADDHDCATPLLCSVCGYEIQPALSHSPDDLHTTLTHHWFQCGNDGCAWTTGQEAHYGGAAADCLDQAMCDVCGDYYGPPGPHEPEDEYTLETAPTCEEDGSEVLYCALCGDVLDTRVLPALGHDWGEWVITQAPTCSATGYQDRVCRRDASHTETWELATDPLAHAWDAGEVTTPAGCVSPGVRTFTCLTDATHTRTETIAALGTSHKHTVTITEPAGCTLRVRDEDRDKFVYDGLQVVCQTHLSVYAFEDDGYRVDEITVNGILVEDGYTFVLQNGDIAVSAKTTRTQCSVTVASSIGGVCSPSGTTWVTPGSSLTLTFTPDVGYRVSRVTLDDVNLGAITSYVLTDIRKGAQTVNVQFAKILTITASAGPGGSISPAGATESDPGANLTYAITPDMGYLVKDVVVDGWWSAGAVSTFTFSGITKSQTIHATFEKGHILAASAGEHGAISPLGARTLQSGASQAYTITPDWGYRIKDVLVDGTSIGAAASHTFTNVQAAHTISASFEALPRYGIVASAGENGSISPVGTASVPWGYSQTYAITPDAGHKVLDVRVDGVSVGALTSYTFTGVQAAHTITAEFWAACEIKVIPGNRSFDGTVVPGTTVVAPGSSVTFTITPDSDTMIESLTVDGAVVAESVFHAMTYTFANVTGDHTISASFATTVNIQAVAMSGGKISPSGEYPVRTYSSITFTITPNAGYRIKEVIVNTANVGRVPVYTANFISDDFTIIARFEPATHTITATAGEHGQITPAGVTVIDAGTSQTYAITPDAGYRVKDVKVNGASVGKLSSYTFTGLNQFTYSIHAEFERVTHAIAASAGSYGTINPAGITQAEPGSSLSFTMTPDAGCRVKDVLVDGLNVGALNSYTFTDITAPHTIAATFEKPFSLTATAGEHGQISPSGVTVVYSGGAQAYHVTPDAGYVVAFVKVDGVNVGRSASYAFSNVQAAHTIEAGFVLRAVTATASGQGTITPAGVTPVAAGGGVAYAITPALNHKISDVLVDGVSVGTVSAYTFTDVQAEHTIHAAFEPIYYTVTTTRNPEGYGVIEPAGPVAVQAGGDVTFVVTPNPGAMILSLQAGGTTLVANAFTPITYTFRNVTGPFTLSAVFWLKYNVTATAGEHGQISPAGVTPCKKGDFLAYAITPDVGYKVKEVLIDGWWNAGAVTAFTFSGMEKDHTIHATFEQITYAVTATAGAGGTVSPSGTLAVAHGQSKAFTFTPLTGYVLSDVKVDGVSVGKPASYTLTNVTAPHTVQATFADAYYAVTLTAGEHGSLSPEGTVQVKHNDNLAFSVIPDEGYQIKRVLVDDVDVGKPLFYTLLYVRGPRVVTAEFEPIRYRMVSVAGPGGSISPSGEMEVAPGSDVAYAITPDWGYAVSDVLVDARSVGAVGAYTFTNVRMGHNIQAFFAPAYFAVTPSASAGGSVTPSAAQSVRMGEDVSFTITPSAGYVIADVLVDGVSFGTVTSYTFTNVTAAHTISATFVKLTYTLTATAGAGGSISPSGAKTVDWGGGQAYAITPNSGYAVADVLVDGVSVGAVTSYSFANVTANHEITAAFVVLRRIEASPPTDGGTITPSGVTWVKNGASQTYTITPVTGFHVTRVVVDGVNVGAVSTYTFTNVTADHTIRANFEQTLYTITVSTSSGGRVMAQPTAYYNDYVILNVEPDRNFRLKEGTLKVNGSAVSPDGFVMPAANVVVTAEFEQYRFSITVVQPANGFILLPKTEAYMGSTVVMAFRADEYYELDEGKQTVNGVPFAGTSFIMPAQDVTVTAVFKQTAFSITVSTTGSGTVTAPTGMIAPGTVVDLTITPVLTYRLEPGSLRINGTAIGGTSFTMPAENVTVTANFQIRYYDVYHSFQFTKYVSPDKTITCKGPFADLVDITLDGGVMPDNWYTAVAAADGSTIVTFDCDKLDTLHRDETYYVVLRYNGGKGYLYIDVDYIETKPSRAA